MLSEDPKGQTSSLTGLMNNNINTIKVEKTKNGKQIRKTARTKNIFEVVIKWKWRIYLDAKTEKDHFSFQDSRK